MKSLLFLTQIFIYYISALTTALLSYFDYSTERRKSMPAISTLISYSRQTAHPLSEIHFFSALVRWCRSFQKKKKKEKNMKSQ